MAEDDYVNEDNGIFRDTEVNVNLQETAAVASSSDDGITKETLTSEVVDSRQLAEAPNAGDGPNAAAGTAGNADNQGIVNWDSDSQVLGVIEAMDATNHVWSQPWSETTTEADGDLYVAPAPTTSSASKTPKVKDNSIGSMLDDPTGKKALHKRLNKRSANFIRKISVSETSSSNDSIETMISASLKAASEANVKALPKIQRLTLPPVAVQLTVAPSLPLVAGKVADIPLPILAEEMDSNLKASPPAAAPGSQEEADNSTASATSAAAPGSQMEVES
jgi:hypothetical protein